MFSVIKEIASFLWEKTSLWGKVVLLIVGAPTGMAAIVMWYQTSKVEASLYSIEEKTNARILRLEEIHALRINHINSNILEIKKQNEVIYQHLLSTNR